MDSFAFIIVAQLQGGYLNSAELKMLFEWRREIYDDLYSDELDGFGVQTLDVVGEKKD